MNASPRVAGAAGVFAGVGLLVEGILWSTSGWTAETFQDPATALTFLEVHGTQLRAAVFAGAINLVAATVFIVGLADRLASTAPTRAAAARYFGLIGIAGHSLVPLGLWVGVPTFASLAVRDPGTATGAWAGYAGFQAAAAAVGALFLGLSTLAAGWAITRGDLPTTLGWLGILAGAASIVTVLAAETPLAVLAAGAYLPALTLAIIFRSWAGIALWRARDVQPHHKPVRRTAGDPAQPTAGDRSERPHPVS